MKGPPQMLATMLLSQNRVSSFSISNSWYFLRARYKGHSRITWAAIQGILPQSQIVAEASPRLYIDDWNLSTPAQRRLSHTLTDLGRSMPSSLELGFRTKRRSSN